MTEATRDECDPAKQCRRVLVPVGDLGDLFPQPGFWRVAPRAKRRERCARSGACVAVDGDQRGLLLAGQALVGADGRFTPAMPVRRRRGPVPGGSQAGQAGLGEQRPGGHVQRFGEQLEHAHRWQVQAPLELAQVGIGEKVISAS